MNTTMHNRSKTWWITAMAGVLAVLVLVITQSWAGATQSDGERPILVPIAPCRLADTRIPIGPNATLGPDSTITVAAHGTNGQCTIPTDAVALSMNVTSLHATEWTYLTIWPEGPMPNVSSLNPQAGQPPTPNAVVTPLSATGSFLLYNFGGSVDVIVDVNGYFAHHDHDDRYDTSAEVDAKIAANPGPQGPPGVDGQDGTPGADGGSCSVADNGNNTGTLTCDDGTSVIVRTMSIPKVVFLDGAGDGTGNLLVPYGVAVDGSGNVYVVGGAHTSHDGVFKVTPGGAITEIIDHTGDGTNLLRDPQSVAVDGSGNVYVAGRASDNAFKVTSGGVITEILDATGDGGGNTLNGPRGVAVDGSGNVYVAGRSSSNVFKVTP